MTVYKFDKETLWKLRQEICLGSLFIRDYENTFGIDAHVVCDFFDGFCDYIWELAKEDGLTEFVDGKYDNKDELWNYFYGMEYPFGTEYQIKIVEE